MNRDIVLLDQRFTKIFKEASKIAAPPEKEAKLKTDFQNALEKMPEGEVRSFLAQAFKNVCDHAQKRWQLEGLQLLHMAGTLRDGGLKQTASFLFKFCIEGETQADLAFVLPIVPDAGSLELWRKKKKMPVKELQRQLLVEIKTAYASPGANWVLEHGNASEAPELLELFLRKEIRPQNLLTWFESLSAVLSNKKSSEFLRVLIHQAKEPAHFDTIVQMVTAFPFLGDLLPELAAEKNPPSCRSVCEALGQRAIQACGNTREVYSALMARIGTGVLLLKKRNPECDAMLQSIRKSGQQMRQLTREKEEKEHSWILENLEVPQQRREGGLRVSEDGAMQIAIAFEKAAQGFKATEILTMTARNLGLKPIGASSEIISFNPLLHHDKDGGLLPGSAAVIEEAGWKYGEIVVLRANVRRKV